VGDVRESPAIRLIELLAGLGAEISYHDPHVADLSGEGMDLVSIDLDDAALERADIVCVVTAHSGIDYQRIADRSSLVVDFRNVVPRSNGRVHTL
jgi:UDP-N-acetyl-D-glucosamine dehydrogenase